MLQRPGFAVEVAPNGKIALEMLQTRKYDLVLMDCQMPELDGFEATRIIRSWGDHYEHLPVVAVTANALAGEDARCRAAGMNDYLSKPVRKEALEDVLTRWLPSREAQTQNPIETLAGPPLELS